MFDQDRALELLEKSAARIEELVQENASLKMVMLQKQAHVSKRQQKQSSLGEVSSDNSFYMSGNVDVDFMNEIISLKDQY